MTNHRKRTIDYLLVMTSMQLVSNVNNLNNYYVNNLVP